MGVHDQIRSPSFLGEGHILFGNDESANTLLSVSTGKLISEFGPAHLASNCLYNGVVVIGGKYDPINIVGLAV